MSNRNWTNGFSSVQFSCSVTFNSLQPHGLQYTRLPCPSPIPGAYSDSCPLNRWCHPTISSLLLHFKNEILIHFKSVYIRKNSHKKSPEAFTCEQFFAASFPVPSWSVTQPAPLDPPHKKRSQLLPALLLFSWGQILTTSSLCTTTAVPRLLTSVPFCPQR